MRLRLFKCKHDWRTTAISNVIQLDDMGYPLKLVNRSCVKCGQSKQEWVDVSEKVFDKIKTGENVLLKWTQV